MRQMKASQFKAQCLSVLNEVERTGKGVIVTKRGRPVARVVSIKQKTPGGPAGIWRESVEVVGDIISPTWPLDDKGPKKRRTHR